MMDASADPVAADGQACLNSASGPGVEDFGMQNSDVLFKALIEIAVDGIMVIDELGLGTCVTIDYLNSLALRLGTLRCLAL